MAGADRAVNMPLRVVGLDGVKRDFKAVGTAGDQAFGEIGKAAEGAYRKSEAALNKMRAARAQAEAIAKTTFDTSASPGSGPVRDARKNFILGQLKEAKAGIAGEARAAGVAAEALAASAGRAGVAVDGMGAALGGAGLAAGVAAAGIGAVVLAGGALASATDAETVSLSKFEAQLKLSGVAAGLTAADIEDLARRTAGATGQTEDSILQASNAIANLPGITNDSFNQIIPVAARLADVLGTDVASEATKMGAILSQIATGDVKELEKSIAGLDPVLQATILSLTEAGRTADAQKAYLDALSDAADGPTGLSVAVANLSNKWVSMLAEWGRTTGIAAGINDAIRGVGGWLDWLKGKAAAAGPAVGTAVSATLNPLGFLSGKVRGAIWPTAQTPGSGAAGPTRGPVASNADARLGLAARQTAEEFRQARMTTKEKQKQADIDRLSLRYRQAGLSVAEATAKAGKIAGQLEAAREGTKAREPAAQRAREAAARRAEAARAAAARKAEQGRLRGIRNTEAFDSQQSQLDGAILASKRAAANDDAVIADFARQQIAVEAEKTADAIRAKVALHTYTDAQGDILIAKNDELKRAKLKAIDDDLAARQARDRLDVATAAIDNDRDLLRNDAALATTMAARRRIGLQLLDLDYRKERAQLAAVTIANGANETDVEIAKAKLKILDDLKAGDAAALRLQTQSPLEAFFAGLPRTIDEVGEAMDRVRVDHLEKLNNRTHDLADGISGAFGRAAGDIARFTNPLEVLKNLVGDLATTFTQTFVTEPATDWVRRRAGGIAERLTGGTAGDYGLTQGQMNAAAASSTLALNALAASATTASAALGGAGPLTAVNDNLDVLAGSSGAAAEALHEQTDAVGRFGGMLGQVIASLTGTGGGGAGLFGSLLSIAGSAFGGGLGGGITRSGVAALNPAALAGIAANPAIFHTGTRSVGPGGFRRSVPAAMFDNAPRLHDGTMRLGSDEFAAVLKRKEDVLTESESAALRSWLGRPARREAPGGGPMTVVNINAPQPANPRRIGAVVARSTQLAQGRAAYRGLAAGPRRS